MTKQSVTRRDWLIPTGLILLSLVPAIAGSFRITQLAGGAEITPDNARFFASPVPVVLHIVGASVFCVLGAFQFSPGLRRRRRGWHRMAGRLLVPAGLIAALSGLWMTVFYPKPPGDGLLTGERLVVGSAMATAIVLGFLAIRRRDIHTHRAWMTRGYALGQGAGTQLFTLGLWGILIGPPVGLPRALLHGVAWIVNLGLAEWIIRRPAVTRTPALV